MSTDERGIGALVDRLSILSMKQQHKPSPAYFHEAQRVYGRLLEIVDPRARDALPWELSDALALAAINGEIWGLEDQIRAFRVQRDSAAGKVIGLADWAKDRLVDVAMEIQELNDRRAALVTTLNGETPSGD